MRRARAFNLSVATMRSSVLEPWAAGRQIELGDQSWIPAESSLRILEGPELAGPDLAYGKGWSRAERSATDVTRRLLDAELVPTVAVHADDALARRAVEDAVARIGWTTVPWAAAEHGRARFAVCVLDAGADPLAAFALGAAIALAGDRVIVLSASALGGGEPVVIDALAAQLAALSARRAPGT
jgi:hypothetical protein